MKKTAKRLLALGMTLSIAVGMFPVTAMAADMPDSYDFSKSSNDTVLNDWAIAGGDDRADSDLWEVTTGKGLVLTTHTGDIYGAVTESNPNTNNAKNIFVQNSAATGDWVAETKIILESPFTGAYQQGAILAYVDDDNYVKLSYEYNDGYGGEMILQLTSETEGVIGIGDSVRINVDHFNSVYLQLTKDDNKYSAAYSTDGVDFDPVGDVDNTMDQPLLGLAAFNGGGAGNKAVTFAYIAAMTAEQAAAVAALETAIEEDLPASASAVTTADFADIDAAQAQYDALSGLALRDTLVNEYARLNALVAKVAAMRADIAAAKAVDDLIDAIGPVELNDTVKAAIKNARDDFDDLTDAQKGLVTKLAVLEAAEAAYDTKAAEAVDTLITAIPTPVTLNSKDAIEDARDAYTALTEAQQAKVTKKDVLEAAEATLASLEAVADVETKIAAIDEKVVTTSEAGIKAAREAFDALTDEQEAAVSSSAKTALTNAEAALAVVQKIHAIDIVYATDASKNEIKAARDAYNALTSNDLKAMVGNYATLQNAEKAQTVVEKIAAIGTVAATSACKDKIADARSAFNALTDAQEAVVGNETTLLTAETDYVKALINDIGTVTLDSKAKIEAARTAYKNLTSGQKTAVGSTIYAKLTAAEAALADLTAADAVDTKIDAIGTVAATAACKAKIDAARTAYDALTTAQKALVKKYDDLKEAEQLYALLSAFEDACDGGVNCPAFLFVDVDPTQWYHAAVDYALDEGLFKGVSATQFAPNGTMTRAMIWTVLARMDDTTLAVTDPWYKSAQNWAVNNQVSDGATPDGSVTREQLVTMLWRFMDEPQANGSLAGYPDAGKVSSWAKEAMTWAVANGVVNGVGNANGTVTLNPGATATRAQVAQLFMNFLTK